MDEKLIPLSLFEKLPKATAGHDVLRYISMPKILGDEKDTILYFIGRQLARQIEIESLDDLNYLFQTLQWGQLELVKDRRRSLLFHLMSDELVERMMSPIEVDFRLEAGFIAEAIEKITQRSCECNEAVNQRLYRVEFKVVYTDN